MNWDGLGLSRVVFLVSRHTASASEVLIATLRDHIQVVTVGETTTGKGVGCREHQHGAWRLCILDAEYTGWRGTAVPPTGFKPDIPAQDDLASQFGDPQEPLLKAALDFLVGG